MTALNRDSLPILTVTLSQRELATHSLYKRSLLLLFTVNKTAGGPAASVFLGHSGAVCGLKVSVTTVWVCLCLLHIRDLVG